MSRSSGTSSHESSSYRGAIDGRPCLGPVRGRIARSYQGNRKQAPAIDATDADAEAELRKQVTVLKHYQDATNAVVPTPPTITLTKRMTLIRGGREIQLLFFGRGHTGGDVVVYLPQERVVATGDLLTGGLGYLGNAYLKEWADTLEEVKNLDFDVVLPGHGTAFEDIEKIDHFQAYLRDLWTKIVAKHEAGVSEEEGDSNDRHDQSRGALSSNRRSGRAPSRRAARLCAT